MKLAEPPPLPVREFPRLFLISLPSLQRKPLLLVDDSVELSSSSKLMKREQIKSESRFFRFHNYRLNMFTFCFTNFVYIWANVIWEEIKNL